VNILYKGKFALNDEFSKLA